MSTTDIVSGLVRVALNFQSIRSNPTGKDRYDLSYNLSYENTESAGDNTAGRLRCLFHEEITVTTSDTVLSLADSADPMGGLGSNAPSADPEGGGLKILAIKNNSPSDGTGQTVFVASNDAGQNAIVGMTGVTYSSAAAAPNDSGFSVYPGGLLLMAAPNNGSAAMNDGTDDELKIKVSSGTAPVEIFYATS